MCSVTPVHINDLCAPLQPFAMFLNVGSQTVAYQTVAYETVAYQTVAPQTVAYQTVANQTVAYQTLGKSVARDLRFYKSMSLCVSLPY